MNARLQMTSKEGRSTDGMPEASMIGVMCECLINKFCAMVANGKTSMLI